MRIHAIETWTEDLALSRPYTIAYQTVSAVQLHFVRLVTDDGRMGYGSASPSEAVTGESDAACAEALEVDRLGFVVGADARHLGANALKVKQAMHTTPAARAAVDMALYDLFGKCVDVPVVDLLGRCHERMLTSITIGIMSVEDTLREADEYVGRGFRCIKVKIGRSPQEDLERLRALRSHVGPHIRLRVDANQGYGAQDTIDLHAAIAPLQIEMLEQPLPAAAVAEMRSLPEPVRQSIAVDESLHHEVDAVTLASAPHPCSIYNIKLMKCGGITSGLTIANVADAAGYEVMWGCMDESVISIAAALHAAYARPATRYLDLDGSLDLARDVAQGGFRLEDGYMLLPQGPGLGVTVAANGNR